jgi:hypothetical protein
MRGPVVDRHAQSRHPAPLSPFGFEDNPAELARIKGGPAARGPDPGPGGSGVSEAGAAHPPAAARAAPGLARRRGDFAQLPCGRVAALARAAATPRARVDAPPLARAAATVPAVRRSESPFGVRPPSVGAGSLASQDPRRLRRSFHEASRSRALTGDSLAHTRHWSQRLHRLGACPHARAGRPRRRRARLRPLRPMHLRPERAPSGSRR